ncbi:hypothetical protein [Streptomyces sp. NPDC055912]|uniref:hypothetical protein n=1 Tax=Streptomyces sp. NPDC055912 TaxID=3345660 RepID=UPI0035DBE3EC
MGNRLERKMLRLLAGGEPVALGAGSASFKKLARLAFLAEQFGYEYADLRRKDRGFTLHLEPDLRPRAQELAAENRRRYPRTAAALLEAAGFTRVPDERGRLRYVPPADAARPR